MKFAIALASILVLAQGSMPSRAQDPAAPTQYINFATAQKMITAALKTATKANVQVGISIVDANGDLVYAVRMDGASDMGVISSRGKARAALLFGLPTKQVHDLLVAGHSVEAKLTAPPNGAIELAIQQGGLPIIRDGKVIGGIGVGGSPSAEDERIAQSGIDSLASK